jgi:CHAD domain-containing protein
VEHSPERELKLAATPDFRMPSIFGLVGPIVRQAPPERNETTYYDTDDLRLARWGASLRHRPGEGWTVKLPAERDAPFLVRPEIVFEGSGGSPPAAAVELVRAFVRSGALHESVRMTTLRRRTELHASDGHLIGGVVDDAVSVHNGAASTSGFRELEVEIGEEMTPSLLDALVERLRQAGAGAPEQTAKYIRALAPTAPLTPEITVVELGPDAAAGEVVRRAIALSVIRLIRHDAIVRLDLDPEGVHQARVATRRLRSDLRTFRPLVDRAWSSALRDELGWIARILGEVRDGDVLLARLREKADGLPDDLQNAAGEAISDLQESRDTALTTLLDALRGDRYVALLDRLVDAAGAPVLRDDASAPATDAIPELVRRPWHKLEKRATKLPHDPTNAELHEIRIRTKRVRYAAEAAAPVAGKPARALAHAAARLQDVLGDLNDADAAAAWLDGWATRAGGDKGGARAAEALAALEREATSELRGHWRAAWEELAEPKLRAWM